MHTLPCNSLLRAIINEWRLVVISFHGSQLAPDAGLAVILAEEGNTSG